MTEQHRAKRAAWENVEAYAKTWNSGSCILELRSRVEALEAAQQKVTVKPATHLHSYRVENSALPIEDWGKGHTAVNLPTHNAPESSDSLVERVAGSLTTGLHLDARAAILDVADWFEQQRWHATAARLRQEAG